MLGFIIENLRFCFSLARILFFPIFFLFGAIVVVVVVVGYCYCYYYIRSSQQFLAARGGKLHGEFFESKQ